ncbi:MAG: glycosyltransferase family 4 protein [Clostridia bacterium]|nr:glycosyltransferase family 4 protein [Clostridia bacterium]
MKLVFVSNYFNHHQKPFCEEMYKRLGEDFRFISTSEMREERKKLGYKQGEDLEYVLLSHKSEEGKKEALSLINNADVVIAGAAPNELLTDRIKSGKLLFRYSERPFKKRISFLKKLYFAFDFRKKDLFKKKNIYMLCASGYAAADYASVGVYKGRTYKWGYFPEVKEYDIDELLSKKKRNTLLWCGRFLDWKHPDDALKLAAKLKESGYDFHLNIVGKGEMEEELKQLSLDLGLLDYVTFLGSMPPERVREYMEEAGIYLFTSDRKEGWGAVLNESMNSGCAVIANQAAGSVPYLLKNRENGLVYSLGEIDALYEKVKYLLDDPSKQAEYGANAYRTLTDMWNAETVVQRILELSAVLLRDKESFGLFDKGPCSIAEIIEDS